MRISIGRARSAALVPRDNPILSALILAARCANYRNVFIAGNVYFTDADCYARMTRVRMCAEHPGLIVRHHDFENFPMGTTPHTTAPLDYAILGLAFVASSVHRPFARSGWGDHFAAAGVTRRLVPVVVGAPDAIPISRGDAFALRHQPDPRSRKRAGPARSSIASDFVGDDRALRGVGLANELRRANGV